MKVKPFLEILRKAAKSKYSTVLLHNRMLLQCYSVEYDSDIGLHYILHFPTTDDYSDEFYDKTMFLNPKDILAAYKIGHDIVLAHRKEHKDIKPKDVREEFYFTEGSAFAQIKFLFIVQDEILSEQVIYIQYPIDPISKDVEVITSTYTKMLHRIKIGGNAVAINGYDEGLRYLMADESEIYYYKIKIGPRKVRIPLYKSMFQGIKDYDEFFVSVQETNVDDNIYLYTIQLAKNDIIEQFIGYIINF